MSVVAIVGTKGPFPRLVHGLAGWAARNPGSRVWVQHGLGELPAPLEGSPQIPRAELLSRLAEAEVVVVHAGTGTILDALRAGHVPVVVPRRLEHGEHVNDHQLEIVRGLGDRIVACLRPESPEDLDRAIAAARARGRDRRTYHDPLEGPLRKTIGGLLERRRPLRTRLVCDLLEVLTRAVPVPYR
jgi:hypothetical protein